jgi:cellulose synthase/poly-beta-1,6-N-acetylglucosamine synthase-like glycosyltransferase
MGLRNLMVYPALSRSGSVHVLNGECYAVRRDLALQYLNDFQDQRFMGKKFDSGDDGWMTTLLLRHGHKTVFQATALAVTEPPVTLRGYVRQQLRWNRNSTRRTLHAITQKWAYKRGPMYPFHLFITLIRAPFWMTIIVLALIRYLTGTSIGVFATRWFEPTWSNWRIVLFVLAIIIVRCLRGLPYLLREPKAFIFLPLYAFIAPFLLAPMKIYAMLTVRNANWITRGGATASRRWLRAAQAGMYIMAGLMFFFFPLVGLAIALADDEVCPY